MLITSNERIIAERLKDPIYHLEKVQGIKLQPHQSQIVEAIKNHSKVVVTSCHGLGKTFTASRLVLWFGSSFAKSKIITTAPTFRQVKSLLWSEIRSGYSASKHELGGQMLNTQWNIDSDWFAMGVASRKEAGHEVQGSAFQGIHAPYVLIVFDEAQGVPPDIWRQAEGMLTGANIKMIAIGNPLTRGNPFHQATQDPYWFHVKLSCFNSPNLIANNILNKPNLIDHLDSLSKLSIEERLEAIDKYKIVDKNLVTAQWVLTSCLKNGISHPLVLSKVLGEFPRSDQNSLITMDLLDSAINRGPSDKPPKFIGVDVARMGRDSTSICLINDEGLCNLQVFKKRDNTEIAGRVSQFINNGDIEAVAIDGTGVGSGVIDIIKENIKDGSVIKTNIIEVHFGASATSEKDKRKFSNLKAQMFSELKDELQAGFGLNQLDCWNEQLPDIRFNIDSKGRIKMESKEEYESRTGKGSPDESDALALAIFAKNSAKTKNSITFDLGGVNLSKNSQWSLK